MAKDNIFSNILGAVGKVGQGVLLASKPGAAYERSRIANENLALDTQQMEEQKRKNYFDIASQIASRVETLPQEQQAAALDNLSKFFSDPERRKLITQMPITQPPAGMKPAISKVGETTYYSPETMAAAKGTRDRNPYESTNALSSLTRSLASLQAALPMTTGDAKTRLLQDIEDTRQDIAKIRKASQVNPLSVSGDGADWVSLLGGRKWEEIAPDEQQEILRIYTGETESPAEPNATGEPPAGTPEFVTRQARQRTGPNDVPETPTPTTPTPTAQKYGMKESVVVGGTKYTVGSVIAKGGKRYIVDHIENGKPKFLPAK